MNFNFYSFVTILAILGAPIPFLKKDILSHVSIIEEMIFTSLFILCMIIPIYYLYEKKSMNHFISNISSYPIQKLIVYGSLILFLLFISGTILQNHDSIIQFKSYQRSINLLFITFIGCCIYHETFTKNTLLGILFVLFGMYLLDKK
jgi:hypothetical protein